MIEKRKIIRAKSTESTMGSDMLMGTGMVEGDGKFVDGGENV